jgi:putative flippase GtrA
MTQLVRDLWARREVRFLVIGGLNTLLGLGLFAAFHALIGDDVPYPLLLVPTYGVSIPIAFAMQRRFVFDAEGGSVLVDLARYTFVQLTSIGLNAVLLFMMVEFASLPVVLAQAITVAIIVVVTYFSHLLFSFRRPEAPAVPDPRLTPPAGPDPGR